MDNLGNIIGIIRAYVNRCVKCDSGRKGTCPWIAAFDTPAVQPVPDDKTREDRAIAAHETAGSPCADQITFDDFIDQIDAYATRAEMPQTTDELIETLTLFEQFLSRLSRMPKAAQAAFADSTKAAIEHALAALDWHYLRRGLDILTLIRNIHPAYNREQMFQRTGQPNYLVKRYQKKAQPLQDEDAPAETPKQPDQVITVTSNLPPELAGPEAMTFWRRAQQAGFVDDHFHFIGSKTELTIFAATFSTTLFRENRWNLFERWEPYRNYSKTYCEYNSRKNPGNKGRIKAILRIFER